jgi:hypothetical protein
MKHYSELEIDIMLGLDDIAHNRMYEVVGKKHVPVRNYGKRNLREKCYCAILRKLRVKG